MEKRLYDLDDKGPFSTMLPPLSAVEDMFLRNSIQDEGCIEALDVWNGVIVDGHNRYRICKELGIPFAIREKEFDSEADATVWLIRKQLSRRNVPDFVKCEIVLPIKDSLLEEGRRRMNWRSNNEDGFSNLRNHKDSINTEKMLADMAGVSQGSLYYAKWLLAHANESVLKSLRAGVVSIYKAKEMTKWFLETADDFTKLRIHRGMTTLEEAYDVFKEIQKEQLEQAKAQGAEDDDAEWDNNNEWDEGSEDEPTQTGQVVPITAARGYKPPMVPTMMPPVVNREIMRGIPRPNQPQLQAGKVVSIVPYLKAKGWNPEEAFNESNSDRVETTNGHKGEIISIIPFLKARGVLPIDLKEPGVNADQDYYEDDDQNDVGYEAQDYSEDEGQDYMQYAEGRDDADEEPVAQRHRVVNLDDIKICAPTKPLPTKGVSLKDCMETEGSEDTDDADYDADNNYDGTDYDDADYETDPDGMNRRNLETEGFVHTANFEQILSAVKMVTRNYEVDISTLLTAIAPEDRTDDNGKQISTILNDSITTVINKYTEVF